MFKSWTALWKYYPDAMGLLVFLVGMGMGVATVLIFK